MPVYSDGQKRAGAIEILEAWHVQVLDWSVWSDADIFDWVENMGYWWEAGSWVCE